MNTPLLLLDTHVLLWLDRDDPHSMRGGRSAASTHRSVRSEHVQRPSAATPEPAVSATVGSSPAATPLLDLTDFKRDLSELTDRLGQAQDCL